MLDPRAQLGFSPFLDHLLACAFTCNLGDLATTTRDLQSISRRGTHCPCRAEAVARVDIGVVGRGRNHRMNQSRVGGHENVRLDPDVPVVTLPHLMRLQLALAAVVLGRTQRLL